MLLSNCNHYNTAKQNDITALFLQINADKKTSNNLEKLVLLSDILCSLDIIRISARPLIFLQ